MPPKKGKCAFQDGWLENVSWKDWLVRGTDSHTARCKICLQNFDIASMGSSALKSHAAGAKHRKKVESVKATRNTTNINDFFARPATGAANAFGGRGVQEPEEIVEARGGAGTVTGGRGPAGLGSFLVKNDVLKAEVMWALKVTQAHYSYNSCSNISSLFPAMFPDSRIAEQFSCGERKCAYLCCHGIAPHFLDLMTQKVRSQHAYVLLFDESLNKKTKSKQMDVHVRMWEDDKVSVMSIWPC